MNLTVVGVGTEYMLATRHTQMVLTVQLPTGAYARVVVQEGDIPLIEAALQPYVGTEEVREPQAVPAYQRIEEPSPAPEIVESPELAEQTEQTVEWNTLPTDVLPEQVKLLLQQAGLPSVMPISQLIAAAKEVMGQVQPVDGPPTAVYGHPARTVPMDDMGYPLVSHKPVEQSVEGEEEEAPQF